MTKEMLNQMEQFEIFVEKMEEFVNNIRLDGYAREQYDLRAPSLEIPQVNIYTLPRRIEDYAVIFEDVKEIQRLMYPEYETYVGNCVFFDVYWNDTKENRAEYTGETFWIDFEENGQWYIHT